MGTLRHFEPRHSGDVLDLHRLTETLRVSLHMDKVKLLIKSLFVFAFEIFHLALVCSSHH